MVLDNSNIIYTQKENSTRSFKKECRVYINTTIRLIILEHYSCMRVRHTEDTYIHRYISS